MRAVYVFISCLFWSSTYAQIEQSFESFIHSSALQGAAVGISFKDVTTGNSIFEYNTNQFFYPASIQKVITTSTALQLLGAGYQYETKVYYSGSIKEGSLNGNLIIEPSGDPTTNSKHFKNDLLGQVLGQLKLKGITRLAGEVIILTDKSLHNTPQTWLFEDIGNYYGVAPQLFNYKENMYTLSFLQKANGLTPAIEEIDVPVPYKFDLKLTCSSVTTGDHSFILGAPFSLEREIVGTISSGSSTFKVKGANAHPSFTFIEELAKEISIEHRQFDDASKTEILSLKSNVLSSIIRITNYESINLFAEGIFNTLGLVFTNKYTTEAGISVVKDFIKQGKKADSKQIIIMDGSGMSRLNAMTPNFASNWMCDFYENKDFVNSLPVSGVSGTMQYLNNIALKGKVQAKSGSAEGVINYAGYITKNNGEVLAFSIFVNNAFQSRYAIRKEIGAFLESMLSDVSMD